MGAKNYRLQRGAPRYRFDSVQHRGANVRFTGPNNRRILSCRIFDISESGIAFLISNRMAPHVGDIIKLEFYPPGGFQIACLGQVVRIEQPGEKAQWAKFPDTVKVGITFHGLPETYQKMLSEGLKLVLPDQYSRLKREKIAVKARNLWVVQNFWSVLFTISSFAALALFIWYISTHNIRTDNNSTWAEGFFRQVIPSDK